MNANELLQQDVVQQLEWDPAVDASSIGVAVNDGVVTLTGSVPSYAEKFRAVRLVQKIRGVRGIADELEVALPHTMVRSDSEIAAIVIKTLEWDVMVPPNKVQVTVHDGQVKLEGQLKWQYQRRAAEQAVLKLGGVKGVQNLIIIQNPASPKVVKHSIVAALHRSAEEDARRIGVEVVGDRAVLSGTVHTWLAREEAEDAVWAAPGIASVDNRIVVNPSLMVH
jgi:osmotically-inducible protein OsmY